MNRKLESDPESMDPENIAPPPLSNENQQELLPDASSPTYTFESMEGVENNILPTSSANHVCTPELDVDQEISAWNVDPMLAFTAWRRQKRFLERKIAERSLRQYTAMFGLFLRWLQEQTTRKDDQVVALRLVDVTAVHLKAFMRAKEGRSLRANSTSRRNTRRRYLYVLSGVYGRLQELGLVQLNPAQELLDDAEPDDFLRSAPVILGMRQIERFVRTTKEVSPERLWHELRDRAIRLLFLASGITVAELQGLVRGDLRWADDHSSLQLRIRPHGFVQERMVPVAEFAVEAMEEWMTRLEHIAPLILHVFPARISNLAADLPRNRPVSSCECYLIVQEKLESIGCRSGRRGPQTLRNSFVARQIWHGVEAPTISRWLGLHTNETVQKISRMVPVRRDGPAPY